MKATMIIEQLKLHQLDETLLKIYKSYDLEKQTIRYKESIQDYIAFFDNDEIHIFSVPGRSELIGNHTDHQRGKVIAGAISLDAIGIVSKQSDFIEIYSKGFDKIKLSIDNLEYDVNEEGTSLALVKGILYKIKELGFKFNGFKAFITSDVLIGSGLSSSAVYEVLITTIINGLYCNGEINDVDIAKISQFSENQYFGKPSGLMDQMSASVGGIVYIDFNDLDNVIVEKTNFDFDDFNHKLIIIDTLGNHADLTEDYASIPLEMKKIAEYFDKDVLREVDFDCFLHALPELRKLNNERAILRAFHFFNENRRVDKMKTAILNKDIDNIKKTLEESGNSSYKLLQNCYSNHDFIHQPIPLALAIASNLMNESGVLRVHGGGFAGTIQVIVKKDKVDELILEMERVFVEGCCLDLSFRSIGNTMVI